MAFATVVAVEVHGHEDTWATHLVRALTPQARDLVVRVHLVELQHCKLHLLTLVLNLLWLGVGLLLALLRPAVETRGDKDRGLVLQACSGQRNAGLQLAATEDESLILRQQGIAQKLRLQESD